MTGWRALALAGVLTAAVSAPAADQPCGTRSRPPHRYAHVVWIWLENHGYDQIIGNPDAPYLNALAAGCGLARNYRGITHASLPNYIGAVTGLPLSALQPFLLDCNPGGSCLTAADSIFAQARSWKAYQESMPENCALTGVSPYGVRHNPPAYLTALAGTCPTLDVPYTALAADLAADTLPAFAFVTPDNVHNMHDPVGNPVRNGDVWLAAELPKLLQSDAYRRGRTAVFVTFDEGEVGPDYAIGEDCTVAPAAPSCHVPTIVVSPSTRPGTVSDRPFDHYSLLRTTEQLLAIRRKLGRARTTRSMRRAFRL